MFKKRKINKIVERKIHIFKTQLDLLIKDTNKICNILDLPKSELEKLSKLEIRIATKYCDVFFKRGCPLEGGWENYAFIIPKDMGHTWGFPTEDKKFISQHCGTGSWIFCKDEELKNKLFTALKNEEYDICGI